MSCSRGSDFREVSLSSAIDCLFRLRQNARDGEGNTALHLCAGGGFEEAASIVVSRLNTHVNAVNLCGETPLTLAAKSGNTSILHKLIGTSRLKMGRPQHLYLLHKLIVNCQIVVLDLGY
jgi:ankyrin repeat protein